MKKRALILLLIAVLSFFTLTGFENDRDFEIVVGDDYYYCYYDESYKDVTERLNEIYSASNKSDEKVYDKTKLKSFFTNNDIRFFAVSKNDASQIRIAVYNDKVSEKIGDLSQNSDSRIGEFAEDLIGVKNIEYEIYRSDAGKYIMLTSKEEDPGGSYVVTQLITVYNGKVFNVSFFNKSGITDNERKILDTFKIKETNSQTKIPVSIVIFSVIGIALLTCIIIVMIWGLIHRKKKPIMTKEDDFKTEIDVETNLTEDEEDKKE